jgi:hypothetical protein
MGLRSYWELTVYDKDGDYVSPEIYSPHKKDTVLHSGYAAWYNEENYDNFWDESQSWYEMEEDMTEYSKFYPELIFNISEETENGDKCEWYFHNGEAQACEAIITYEPCKFFTTKEETNG